MISLDMKQKMKGYSTEIALCGFSLMVFVELITVNVTGLECMTCANETTTVLCSTAPTFSSCTNPDEVCFSEAYLTTGVPRSHKGCMDRVACQQLEDNSDAVCESGELVNYCAYCCDTERCNFAETEMCSEALTTLKSCFNSTFDLLITTTITSNGTCDELKQYMTEYNECLRDSAAKCPQVAAENFHSENMNYLKRAVDRACQLLPQHTTPSLPRQALASIMCDVTESRHCFDVITSILNGNMNLDADDISTICMTFLPGSIECADTKSRGCDVDRREGTLKLIAFFHDDCESPVCDMVAADTCLQDLNDKIDSGQKKEACLFRYGVQECVQSAVGGCEPAIKDLILAALWIVLDDLQEECTHDLVVCQDRTIPIDLVQGRNAKKITIYLGDGPRYLCKDTTDCRIFLDFLPVYVDEPPRCRSTNTTIPKILLGDIDDHTVQPIPYMEITQQNWQSPISIHLTAKLDFTQSVDLARSFNVQIRKMVGGTMDTTSTGIVCTYKINVKPASHVGVCHAVNDPHITTFDGRSLECHVSGTIRLYRHTDYPYEVQAMFGSCGYQGVTCTCGVIVRSWNTIYVVDGCNKDSFQIYMIKRSDIIDLQSFRSSDGKIIDVILPHGFRARITLYPGNGHSLLNIHLYASPYDNDHTEGLCGLFNGNSDDDSTGTCVTVPKGENLFQTDFKTFGDVYQSTIAPTCLSMPSGASGNENPVCEPDGSMLFDPCHLELGHETTTTEKNLNEHPRATQQTGSLSGSYIQVAWDEASARQTCITYLRDKDPVDRCTKIPYVNVTSIVENCVLDILYTKSTNWLDTALDTVIMHCFYELGSNLIYLDEGPGFQLGDELIKGVLCLNDCSGNGQCKSGVCTCTAGFYGPDCSLTYGEAPLGLNLPNRGMCDTSTDDCSSAIIHGNNLLQTDNLKCQLTPTEVSDINPSGSVKDMVVGGVLININQVACPLPLHHPSFDIRLALDGNTYSDRLSFIRYDHMCYGCVNITGTFVCSGKEDICKIENQCYAAGAPSPGDSCFVCSPEDSTTSFTRRSGARCWKQWKVIVLAVCLAVPLASVIIVLIVCTTQKKPSKIQNSREDLNYQPDGRISRADVKLKI